MPDIPDYTFKQNFPISSVIDAASRNAQLQQQAQQAGQQSLIAGLQSIGQIGTSLYQQKQRMAQALALGQLYGQSPQGQQMQGTNTVATSPTGAPVTQNQTAAYDPTTGTVTPNAKPPIDLRAAFMGAKPEDVLNNLTAQKAASTEQGKLALDQAMEPQKLAVEKQKVSVDEQLRQLLLGIQGKNAQTEATKVQNDNINNLRTRRDALVKNLSWNPLSESSDASKQEIANIDAQLAKLGQAPTTPQSGISTTMPSAVGEEVQHPSGVTIKRIK